MSYPISHPTIKRAFDLRNKGLENRLVNQHSILEIEIIDFDPTTTPNTKVRVVANSYIDDTGTVNIPEGKTLQDGVFERTVAYDRQHINEALVVSGLIDANGVLQYALPFDSNLTSDDNTDILIEEQNRINLSANDVSVHVIEDTDQIIIKTKPNCPIYWGKAEVLQDGGPGNGGSDEFYRLFTGTEYLPNDGTMSANGSVGSIGGSWRAAQGGTVKSANFTVPDTGYVQILFTVGELEDFASGLIVTVDALAVTIADTTEINPTITIPVFTGQSILVSMLHGNQIQVYIDGDAYQSGTFDTLGMAVNGHFIYSDTPFVTNSINVTINPIPTA